MKTLLFSGLLLGGLVLTACKKDIYGCTSIGAINYSTEATKDDGSCFTKADLPQQVFEEQFSLGFGPSAAYAIYYPSFNYEPGDLIVIENLSDPTFNYYTALPVVVGNVVIWGEYGYADGDIWVYTDNVTTGADYFYGSNVSFGFRALLVKKKSFDANPDLAKMKISEIKKLMD